MQFFRYTESTDTTEFVNFIPAELWNFTLVSYLKQKPKEGGEGELQEGLIFETSTMVDVLEDLVKEVKHDRTGKILTRKFENKIIKRPYQITLTNKEEIASIVKWLESNVIKYE